MISGRITTSSHTLYTQTHLGGFKVRLGLYNVYKTNFAHVIYTYLKNARSWYYYVAHELCNCLFIYLFIVKMAMCGASGAYKHLIYFFFGYLFRLRGFAPARDSGFIVNVFSLFFFVSVFLIMCGICLLSMRY